MKSRSPVEVGVFGLLLLLAGSALVLLVPLLGVWVTSSIGTYLNAPSWVAVAGGVLLCPVLPLVWDAWALARRRKKGVAPRMSAGPRIVLRVLVLNVLAVGLLLAFAPKLVFTALSTRGDWMLEGRSGPLVDQARQGLYWGADRLEWLYAWASPNRYAAEGEVAPPSDQPKPSAGTLTATVVAQVVAPPEASAVPAASPMPTASPAPTAAPEASAAPAASPSPSPSPAPSVAPDASPAPAVSASPSATAAPDDPARPKWPLPARPHALLASMPADVETDFASVARYIAEHEANPYQRVRAIHDYVAQRVAYDVEGLKPGKYPSYEPKVVFDRRMGVCAGYANLVQAMVEAIGGKAIVVAGFSREASSTLGNGDHAWNAVEIEGQWYLLDVTWDAGTVNDGRFERGYRTDYLFTPPELFVQTHLPALPEWQLLEVPVSRGEFMRQPLLKPRFYAHGLRLISPLRSQFSVDAPKAELVLSNTRSVYLVAEVEPAEAARGSTERTRCELHYTLGQAHIECPLAGPGKYRLILFGNDQALGSRPYLGEFEVNYNG
jgi:transglutaminase-like putative cysteine protease